MATEINPIDQTDFYFMVTDLHQKFPFLRVTALKQILDEEAQHQREHNKEVSGRVCQWPTAYQRAHKVLLDWLSNGYTYAVDPKNIDDVAMFVASHRRTCVWAVLLSKAHVSPPPPPKPNLAD